MTNYNWYDLIDFTMSPFEQKLMGKNWITVNMKITLWDRIRLLFPWTK